LKRGKEKKKERLKTLDARALEAKAEGKEDRLFRLTALLSLLQWHLENKSPDSRGRIRIMKKVYRERGCAYG